MPLEQIMKEKISADHLLYVSLKYTKTCDVILNLLKRWTIMIDLCLNALLAESKRKKKIKSIPSAPRQKIELTKKAYKNQPEVIEAIEIYEFFKRSEALHKEREHEFRKDVRLRINDQGKEVIINLDQLKEYARILENFISFVKQTLLDK